MYNTTRRMDIEVEPSDSPGNDEAAAFLVKDVSGSTNSGQHLLADTVFWRFEEELSQRYEDVETMYLLSGSASRSVNRETFYGPHEGRGGGGAVNALQQVGEQIERGEEAYLVMAGDGFYAEQDLYTRLGSTPPAVAAHVAVYAGQDERVPSFPVELDDRWTYDGVVVGPDEVDTVCDEIVQLLDG